MSVAEALSRTLEGKRFSTILADPPWRFDNRTGKVAPEYQRFHRYETLSLDAIKALPVGDFVSEPAHCYLWVPNALLPRGLEVMTAWGFDYKSNLIWQKLRRDGQTHRGGVGFYFRNCTEVLLFGIRGKNARTLDPGRRQVNLFASEKNGHSRKPDTQYSIIEQCSRGPYLELFARGPNRPGWTLWGDEAPDHPRADWTAYQPEAAMA